MPIFINERNELLKTLILSFFHGSLHFSLEAEDVKQMTWFWQQQFLEATVHSELVRNYPVSCKFKRLFLKKVIAYLEPLQEVHDGFYTQLCSAMNNNNNDFCYRHYVISNDLSNIITIKETKNMVVNGTTGMRTWEAAIMLADWALCNKDIFDGKNVLEIGSGVGFTGITVGKLCQIHSIMLTDCHCDVLNTICDNMKINFPDFLREELDDITCFKDNQKTLGVRMLDWNKIEDLPDDIVPDIIIGADIVYDPSILAPLCSVIKTFFKRNNNLEVYIASVVRNEATFTSFLKMLDTTNLEYEKIILTESVFIKWDHSVEKCFLKIKHKT